MHLIPFCMGPLWASGFGGTHVGKGRFADMKNRIEYSPYRYTYGDDELFTRDMIWPVMKASGSIMTHHYSRSELLFILANPYRGSCEEPTQAFCDEMKLGGTCKDVLMPDDIESPLYAMGLRGTLAQLSKTPAYFDIRLDTERGRAVRRALSVNP
jgi:hypothetical protein